MIDVKDVYLQVPIHQSSWKHLCFICDGTIYLFEMLKTSYGSSGAYQGVHLRDLGQLEGYLFVAISGRLVSPGVFRVGYSRTETTTSLFLSQVWIVIN